MTVVVAPLEEVPIVPRPIERFAALLGAPAYRELLDVRARAGEMLHGRTVWSLNSTARGGGVAEMLRSLLSYTRGAGVDARWLVVNGEPEFFAITKRLHNRLHGAVGDGGPLGAAERASYDRALAGAATALAARVRPGDVVVLHDPQTAGLAGPLRTLGAHVVWRAHIGLDEPNALARAAWDFLRPLLDDADALVFSRPSFVWSGFEHRRVAIIAPSIDAFSPKNRHLSPRAAHAILAAAGIEHGAAPGDVSFERADGTSGRVLHRARMIEEQPLLATDRLVTQVSRWDRLKDPVGVLHGFAAADDCGGAQLVLAGPAVEAVADDPEGAEVLAEVADAWRALPAPARRRVHIACLPMDDGDENAAIVNALQSRADVVVQKSLAEGFGLTVAEAMWKARPVLASAVGGIQDQIVDGDSGILLADPADLDAYGRALRRLLADPSLAARLGRAARARVRERFLEPRHLTEWVALLGDLP